MLFLLRAKVAVVLSLLNTTRNYFITVTICHIQILSFRALSVLHKSRYLFNKHGFHNVGVDRIVREAEVPKASFYNYFHSKERLIEMCIHFQKDVLKE